MASRPEMVQVLTATASIFVAGAACFVAWQARKLAEMQVKQHPKLKQAIVVIGAGDHCTSVILLVRAAFGKDAVGAVYDDDIAKVGTSKLGVPVLHLDDMPAHALAVNSIGNNKVRKAMVARFPGVTWATVVHPAASVDESVTIGAGTLVQHRATVQASSRVGDHVFIFPGAMLGAGTVVDDYASVCEGAVIDHLGRVATGSYVYGRFCQPADCVSVLGAGGHSKVVISLLLTALGHQAIDAVYDDDPEKVGGTVLGVPVRSMAELAADARAVIGIGDNKVRKAIDERFPHLQWVTIVHPSAIVDVTAQIGPGTVIFAGAVVQPHVCIGRHAILNSRCSIDHDSVIGDYATAAPGAIICGSVRIGEGSYVHAGSTVRPHRSMAPWCTLGMGAALVRSMDVEGETWVGVPARPMIMLRLPEGGSGTPT